MAVKLLLDTHKQGPQVDEDQSLVGGSDYVDFPYCRDNNMICLDGIFSVEELEAMAVHMRMVQKQAEPA